MSKKLISPIQIPWNEEGNLGRAYQETIELLAPHFEWVVLMDHDVEIVSRDWYRRLKAAIKAHPQAGLLACRVNLQHAGQKTQSLRDREDRNAAQRIVVSERLAKEHGDKTTVIGAHPQELISGCWFAVHAERMLEVGPIPDGFYGVDNWLHRSLHNAGYPAVIMEGMLVWHRYVHLEPRKDREGLKRIHPPALTKP